MPKPQKHHYAASQKTNYISVAIAVSIFLLIMLYFVSKGRPFDLAYSNRAIAMDAVFLIGLSFLLGPLTAFFPKLFLDKLEYRKPLGLIGYYFAIAHVLLSLLVVDASVYAESRLSLVAAMLAILIFTLVAFSSQMKSIQAFGFERWQKIQRTGYLAFFLVIIHFTILENGQFVGRQLGQITLVFALLVLALRILTLFRHPKK